MTAASNSFDLVPRRQWSCRHDAMPASSPVMLRTLIHTKGSVQAVSESIVALLPSPRSGCATQSGTVTVAVSVAVIRLLERTTSTMTPLL